MNHILDVMFFLNYHFLCNIGCEAFIEELYNVCNSKCDLRSLFDLTRKRFSEKPIVAFTNSTVFILGFYI